MTGWAAYLPTEAGRTVSVTYHLHVAEAPTLTDAIWDVTTHQMRMLGTAPPDPGFTLEEALEQRNAAHAALLPRMGPRRPAADAAGYVVHFSPRSGETLGSLLEYGFSGAQTLLAYASIEHAHRRGEPLRSERAGAVIDFFVERCQLPERLLARHLRRRERDASCTGSPAS